MSIPSKVGCSIVLRVAVVVARLQPGRARPNEDCQNEIVNFEGPLDTVSAQANGEVLVSVVWSEIHSSPPGLALGVSHYARQ
jgi:hypothetical protein